MFDFKKVIDSRTITIIFTTTLLSAAFLMFLFLTLSRGAQQNFIVSVDGRDMFMDYYNSVKISAERTPYDESYGIYRGIYPPLSYIALYPVSRFIPPYKTNISERKTIEPFVVLSCALYLCLSTLLLYMIIYETKNGTAIIKFATAAAFLLSGVSIFSIERANLIFPAVIFSFFYLLCYKSDNKVLRELSLAALAAAACLKIYPAFFSILLIFEKRHRDFVKFTAYTLILFFVPFLCLEGKINNLPQLIKNLQYFDINYLNTGMDFRFGLLPAAIYFGSVISEQGLKVAPILFQIIAIILLIISIPAAYLQENLWKKWFILIGIIVLLPLQNIYYTGLYFFLPTVLFLNKKEYNTIDLFYLLLLILIFNPLSLYINDIPITSPLANISAILVYFMLIAESYEAFISKKQLCHRKTAEVKL